MTIDWNDPKAIHQLWSETFEIVRCDWVKANGEGCRIVPAWRDKANGQLLCYVHQPIRWNNVMEEHGASAFRTRD